jgi:hypothetical protein
MLSLRPSGAGPLTDALWTFRLVVEGGREYPVGLKNTADRRLRGNAYRQCSARNGVHLVPLD